MNQLDQDVELNRTHAKETNSFEERIQALKEKILSRGDLPHATCERQLKIIDQLCEFSLGRFIVDRRGANGFWTDYMVSHPIHGRVSGLNIEGKPFTFLENWFLNQCPIVIAHQERFQIFQEATQKLLKEGVVLASIPCGLMRDLLALDFSNITNFELIGVDIDAESLSLAESFAHRKNIRNVRLLQQNAWELPFKEELDVITSSGLNVYEQDPQKVLELYRVFFQALKPGGHLIISVLTYPPGEAVKTDWKMEGVSEETLLLDRILHKDILDIKWRNFRSSAELDKEFRRVGFSEVTIHFDKHHIFPTILARKPIQ